MTFTKEFIAGIRSQLKYLYDQYGYNTPDQQYLLHAIDEIERLQKRVDELEVQLKSKDIIINSQQGRLNYYATKDLLGGKNEHG